MFLVEPLERENEGRSLCAKITHKVREVYTKMNPFPETALLHVQTRFHELGPVRMSSLALYSVVYTISGLRKKLVALMYEKHAVETINHKFLLRPFQDTPPL